MLLLSWALLAAASLYAFALRHRCAQQRLELTHLRGTPATTGTEPRGNRHSVSGLPTREPLLATIRAADHGTLGLVAIADFEWLASFDPALADRVLVAIVARLIALLEGRPVAQVGRGQFGIWFDTDAATARTKIAAFGAALGEPILDGTRSIAPRIAHAIARWPDDDADPAALLARAGAALAIGAGGDDNVADVAAHARERYLLEQDLREAVAAERFQLAFQPLVAVDDDGAAARIVGAEALVRWDHPRRGSVSPTVFVPLLEAMGLADRLGAWALDAACAEAACWPDGRYVAVNVSAQQLGQGDLAALVGATLARHRLGSERLELELTETAASADVAGAAALFDRLRTLGVRVAIDDFGTGFSSLSAVRRLRFDKIKIDREFVADVHRRRDSQAICRSIIALAHGLGAKVLAEGVEAEADFRWLHAEGCRLFQGYRFGAAVDAAAFRQLAVTVPA